MALLDAGKNSTADMKTSRRMLGQQAAGTHCLSVMMSYGIKVDTLQNLVESVTAKSRSVKNPL